MPVILTTGAARAGLDTATPPVGRHMRVTGKYDGSPSRLGWRDDRPLRGFIARPDGTDRIAITVRTRRSLRRYCRVTQSDERPLQPFPFRLNRNGGSMFRLSMIFSENRYTLFRIMLRPFVLTRF